MLPIVEDTVRILPLNNLYSAVANLPSPEADVPSFKVSVIPSLVRVAPSDMSVPAVNVTTVCAEIAPQTSIITAINVKRKVLIITVLF